MTEWRLKVDGSFEEDLYDVKVVDTANPFGNYAVASIDDQEGDKFDTYTRGTRIDLFAYPDNQPNTLTVQDGQTETITDEIRENRKLQIAGTLRIGGNTDSVTSGNTTTVNSGETLEANKFQAEGTYQVEGTLQSPSSISRVGFDESVRQFSGYVVEARELDQQGADALEVEIYSFDQFLRQNSVSTDQSGNTISTALDNIISNDTPITFNSANVTVEDDVELTRSYRGEAVETVLRDFQQKSSNEAFGVNSDLEFFYRPRESNPAPRDIDNTQWFNYDIPEEGKETINEVTVFYDSGDKSVTVDDGGDKKQLQSNLGTDKPVGFSTEVSRENITEIEDARDVGEQILNERTSTLTGTVTTFGLLEASPGDVININIVPRGINGNFRIAEIEYRWGTDETVLTIVEKTGEQDELLVRLSDSVKRVENRNANRDGVSNRITDTNNGVVLPISGDVDGTSYSSARVTNLLRNKLRDGWGDGSTITVSDIAVGNDATEPSRSQTSLGNELERVSVSQSLPDAQSVLFEGSFSETDIREVGIFDSTGDMLARAVIPSTSLSATVNVDLRLDVENDTSFELGVVTTDGQTAVRDLIADNSPSLPTDYAYGSDGTDPTINDSSLGTQEVEVSLDELLVQNADSNSEWNELISVGNDEPFSVANSEFGTIQSLTLIDVFDDLSGGTVFTGTSNFVDQDARGIEDSGDLIEGSFSVAYDISSTNTRLNFRANGTSGTHPEFVFRVDGTDQFTIPEDGLNDGASWVDEPIDGLDAGSHTIEIEATTSSTSEVQFDQVAVYDNTYTYNFDNTTDGNDQLAGPELFPELETKTLATVNTRRELDSGTAEQTWNDTSNNQFIELSNDDGNTFIRTNNSQTASASFASLSTNITTRVGLSRFTSDASTTPTNGDTGQRIDVHDLFANVSAITPADIGIADIRAIVQPGSIVGTTLRESGQLDTSNNLLTRNTFAEFTVQSGERVISSERIRFANP